jgi:large subunit ribosomal protein L28
MAKCDICGKGVTFGIKLSHSHRRTNRSFKPNVQKVKAIVNGTPCRVHACTRCLRSAKVERNIRSPKVEDVVIMANEIAAGEIAANAFEIDEGAGMAEAVE